MNLALKRIESLARTKGRHYRFGKLYWVVYGKIRTIQRPCNYSPTVVFTYCDMKLENELGTTSAAAADFTIRIFQRLSWPCSWLVDTWRCWGSGILLHNQGGKKNWTYFRTATACKLNFLMFICWWRTRHTQYEVHERFWHLWLVETFIFGE